MPGGDVYDALVGAVARQHRLPIIDLGRSAEQSPC